MIIFDRTNPSNIKVMWKISSNTFHVADIIDTRFKRREFKQIGLHHKLRKDLSLVQGGAAIKALKMDLIGPLAKVG